METMQVRHVGFPGQVIRINAVDFDTAVHQRLDPGQVEESVAEDKPKKGKK